MGYSQGSHLQAEFDLTDPAVSEKYLRGFNDTHMTQTSQGICLMTPEGHDPFFTVDISLAEIDLTADDLPHLEIVFMTLATNPTPEYGMEIFLCAGDVPHATAGISIYTTFCNSAGSFQVIRLDLSQSPYWTGEIHSIRIDYFSPGNPGDIMYIKSVKLTSN